VTPEPIFFETPQDFRAWLKKHHASARELIVGYYKTHAVKAGKRSINWPQSVAEALCFGWIDGIRRTIDEDRYTIRFTPRRPDSVWSAINIRLMGELEAAGKMTDAGRAIFEARRDRKSKGYNAQKRTGELDATRVRQFKKNKAAWEYFQSQPPGYRRNVSWWVMQARQEETRARRLSKLIETSATQQRMK
jgi:uncharacterized protein YdeI (YjbR/CyaY-like superfamily)